jgi:hypothetical protein
MVETLALYGAIFSPFVFLYFFYMLYRTMLKGDKTIVWHVAFVTIVLSLGLSVRQKVPIQDFAPYAVVAVPLMVRMFLRSYRVRLPQFRRGYRWAAWLMGSVLVLNTVVLLLHRPLFDWLPDPKRHFAMPFYLPYWCAQALKENGMTAVRIPHEKERLQLRFYGIDVHQGPLLMMKPCEGCKTVTIKHNGREVGRCYVSKINK